MVDHLDETLEIIRPGRRVWVGLCSPSEDNTGVDGVVIEVMIGRGPRIQYRVSWWDGRTRRDEWLDEAEVQSKPSGTPASQKIGFRTDTLATDERTTCQSCGRPIKFNGTLWVHVGGLFRHPAVPA